MGFTKMVAPQTAGTGYDDQGYIYNLLVWTGPEYDIRDYRDYWATPEEKQNWMRDSWYDNPYLMAYEKINRRDNSKYNGMLNLTYEIKPWLKAIVRGGFDNIINSTKDTLRLESTLPAIGVIPIKVITTKNRRDVYSQWRFHTYSTG